MEHLDDGMVWRLVRGAATDTEISSAHAHVVDCAQCRDRILDIRASIDSRKLTRATPPQSEQSGKKLLTAVSASASAAFESSTRVERLDSEFIRQSAVRELKLELETAPLPRGSTVGRYLILQPVGRGGMGIVYAAYDPELDRKVALKLLRVYRDPNDDGQARLLREAQAMARVSHPNVTAIYDAGAYGDQVFLAMELIEGGRTLRDWLLEKRTWREVVDVMVAAGRGLVAAHAAGLVHRDFKPENVLVGLDGRVHVTDFGLARLARYEGRPADSTPRVQGLDWKESSGPRAERPMLAMPPPATAKSDSGLRLEQELTQVGTVVGTPAYMAPEQHLGKPPDTRSDQFSFCATLYRALYDQPAFDPNKLAEAVRGGSKVDPASLIQAPSRTRRVPAFVKRVLIRGLAVSPEARFESMEALLARLSRPHVPTRRRMASAVALVLVLVGAGVLVQREFALRRSNLCSGAGQLVQKAWDPQVEGLVKSAFDATGKPYAPYTFQAIKSSLDGYARDWAAMHTEACLATRVRGDQTEAILTLRVMCLERRLRELRDFTELLTKADESTLEHAVEAVGGLPRISTCADVDALSAPVPPPEDPLTRAEVGRLTEHLAQVDVLRIAGKSRAALDAVENVVEAARKLRYPPLLAEALGQKGFLLNRLGRSKEAERILIEAWSAADVGKQDEVRVRVASELIVIFGKVQSQLPEALRWTELGDAALSRLGRAPELEMQLRLKQGIALAAAGKYAQALPQLERAQALDVVVNGDHSVARSTILNSLMEVYLSQGDNARALRLAEEATAVSERVQGPDHPYSAEGHNNIAALYLLQGNLGRAEEHARKAERVVLAALGPEHPGASLVYDTLAGILARERRFAEATEYAQRALANSEKTLGPNHPFRANPLDSLAYIYLETGRAKQALPLLEQALKLNNPDPGLTANLRFHQARALRETGGDRQRVRELAKQALEGYRTLKLPLQAGEVEHWLQAAVR